jgi:hypothetical protein
MWRFTEALLMLTLLAGGRKFGVAAEIINGDKSNSDVCPGLFPYSTVII